MADYGPHDSISAEGWAVALAFVGIGFVAGSLAYGVSVIQIGGTAIGSAMFIASIYIGWSVKPRGKAAKKVSR